LIGERFERLSEEINLALELGCPAPDLLRQTFVEKIFVGVRRPSQCFFRRTFGDLRGETSTKVRSCIFDFNFS
jgi:hypothetical protein